MTVQIKAIRLLDKAKAAETLHGRCMVIHDAVHECAMFGHDSLSGSERYNLFAIIKDVIDGHLPEDALVGVVAALRPAGLKFAFIVSSQGAAAAGGTRDSFSWAAHRESPPIALLMAFLQELAEGEA